MEKHLTEDWKETHFEVVFYITNLLHNPILPEVLSTVLNTQGRCGLWELASDLTDEFNEKYKDFVWDGEFFDKLEEFLDEYFDK